MSTTSKKHTKPLPTTPLKARLLCEGDKVVLNDGTIAIVKNVEKQTYETVTKHDIRVITYATHEDGPSYCLPIMGYEEVEAVRNPNNLRTISLWSYIMMLFGFKRPDNRTIGTTEHTTKRVTNDVSSKT